MRNELVGPAKSRSEPCEDIGATLTRLMMAGASAPPGTAINALNPAVVHHSKMDRPTSELGHLLPSRRRAESVVCRKATIADNCPANLRPSIRPRDPHDDPPRRREREPATPVATLGQLQHGHCWRWIYCGSGICTHSAPVALAPFVIRCGLTGQAMCCAGPVPSCACLIINQPGNQGPR
jgi:hypothetical protein